MLRIINVSLHSRRINDPSLPPSPQIGVYEMPFTYNFPWSPPETFLNYSNKLPALSIFGQYPLKNENTHSKQRMYYYNGNIIEILICYTFGTYLLFSIDICWLSSYFSALIRIFVLLSSSEINNLNLNSKLIV